MKSWQLESLDVEPHHPQILSSTGAARVIVIRLPEGEFLQDHQVHERAFLVVISGEIELTAEGGERVVGTTGLTIEFDPAERREVRARSEARLLLFLAPWPGDGHPGALTLDEKAHARERAAAAKG
jgi:quercetin dioxygenase-like cupin family protein